MYLEDPCERRDASKSYDFRTNPEQRNDGCYSSLKFLDCPWDIRSFCLPCALLTIANLCNSYRNSSIPQMILHNLCDAREVLIRDCLRDDNANNKSDFRLSTNDRLSLGVDNRTKATRSLLKMWLRDARCAIIIIREKNSFFPLFPSQLFDRASKELPSSDT